MSERDRRYRQRAVGSKGPNIQNLEPHEPLSLLFVQVVSTVYDLSFDPQLICEDDCENFKTVWNECVADLEVKHFSIAFTKSKTRLRKPSLLYQKDEDAFAAFRSTLDGVV